MAKRGFPIKAGLLEGSSVCFSTNLGLVLDWDCHTANVYDGSAFQHMVGGVASEMIVFADQGFGKADWFPANLRLCQPREWNDRMLIETMLSMLTLVCGFKKMMH
ncbi:TPA: hypothetical protein EYG59_15280 [Candidatus Poribacteria bacterium]|nr:hypothetical protein [Candidatus Poribacteria bacterium]